VLTFHDVLCLWYGYTECILIS